MQIKRLGIIGALAAMSCAYPCAANTTAYEDEEATADAETNFSVAEVIGFIEQNDKVLGGRWMRSRVTLRDDGRLIGETHLKNSNSVLGFTGQLIVVLVDQNQNMLHFVDVDSWGINACFFRCPKTRSENWERQIAPQEWETIRSQVRGMALVHRHVPTGRVITWIRQNWNVILPLIKLF